MAKRKEFEESMLTEVAKKIKKDNKTLDELIDKIMQEVEVWVKAHKKDWDELSDEDQSTLTEPTYLIKKVAERKYSREQLRKSIYNNLKRIPGNLGEEQRMLGLYTTLEKFNYRCPYSDTPLIGGKQTIQIDHIIPVAMGGPTDDWNCIPVCDTCNNSKNNRHLLDWWEDFRTQQEEYKLVKIFEHMTSKLLDETNEIKYLETEDKTKHLDAITFLNQLYDHIEENKEHIFEHTFENEKEKTKAIEKKLKELKSTLEKVTNKNNKNIKTDRQHFTEIKEMVKFVKGLGVRSYYKIAYTYFEEIQGMKNLGKSDAEIRDFCFDRDDSFNFTLFYEKLVEYREKHGSFNGVTNHKDIGTYVARVRRAYQGKDVLILTQEIIEKLNKINFPWEATYGQWFNDFYQKLLEYKAVYGSFKGVTRDVEIGRKVQGVRKSYRGYGNYVLTSDMIEKLNEIGFDWGKDKEEIEGVWFDEVYCQLIDYKKKHKNFVGVTQDKDIGNIIDSIRQAYKGKGNLKLTQEMIDKLDEIDFPWHATKFDWFDTFYKELIAFKKQNGGFNKLTLNKNIGRRVSDIRSAYKGKGNLKLTQEMIDKLNEIGFPWEARPKKVQEDNLLV